MYSKRALTQRTAQQAKARIAVQAQAVAQAPAAYDWAQDPIWDAPIPEPPDWVGLSDHEQSVYKLAALAYAVRALSDQRGVTAARQLADWEVL